MRILTTSLAVLVALAALGCGNDAPPVVRKRTPRKRAPAPVETPRIVPQTPKKPQDAGVDEILRQADEQLARARRLYEEGMQLHSDSKLTAAGFEVEEARNKYQVLVGAYTGAEKTSVQEKQAQAGQLLKLIHDEKKRVSGAQNPAPTPSRTPVSPATPSPPMVNRDSPTYTPPPPPPVAKDEPDEPPQVRDTPAPPPAAPSKPAIRPLELFLDYVAQPASSKVEPLREAAASAGKEVRDFRGLIQAISLFVGPLHSFRAFKHSDQRTLFLELAKKHDPYKFPELGPEEIETVLTDVAAAMKKTKKDNSLLQSWGLAHLSLLVVIGDDSSIKKWASELDLKNEKVDGERKYGTPEGFAMGRLVEIVEYHEIDPALKKLRLRNRGVFDAHLALVKLQAWSNIPKVEGKVEVKKELVPLFRKTKAPPQYRDLFKHVADTLADANPCSQCEGKGMYDCPDCRDGTRIEECRQCDGEGKIRMSRDYTRNCPVCQGTGEQPNMPDPRRGRRGGRDDNNRRKGPDCRECRGKAELECRECRGDQWVPPALEELIVLEPCATCEEGGFVFSPLRIPCPDCIGLGKRASKP